MGLVVRKKVGVVEAWKFGSTVAMLVLWSCGNATVVGWLLFTIRSQMWIDAENNGYRWNLVMLPVIEICKGGMSTLKLFWL